MNHGSLFSGIGGFELAAQWMGWQNIFHCEWNPFDQQVLKHHFPESKSYTDVTKFCATAYAGRIDILTGGFPCQPYSLAGKRLGKEDERHLWPEMLRVVRECTPKYVVGENVRGLVNWNGGLVFEEVCTDLEAEGYSVQPFLLPAAGVGAPHRRDRIWFVAYANDKGGSDGQGSIPRTDGEIRQRNDSSKPCNASGGVVAHTDNAGTNNNLRTDSSGKTQNERRQKIAFAEHWSHGINGNASDTSGKRYTRSSKSREACDKNRQDSKLWQAASKCRQRDWWEKFPSFSPICGGNDGLSKKLDGITFSKWRNETIKAYGNAIVPQVALQIFKAIQMMEDEGW